jgi:nucleotide-binding universal stress UspA family protein
MEALRWTAALAADLGASVIALHIFEPLRHLDDVGPGTAFDQVRKEVRGKLESEWCQPFKERSVSVETRLVEGNTAEEMLRVADELDASLIVLGARRLSAVKALVLGSTSKAVLHSASQPVTIVHAPRSE